MFAKLFQHRKSTLEILEDRLLEIYNLRLDACKNNHMETIDELISKLEAVTPESITIYNICHRRAGWGIQWYDASLVGRTEWEVGNWRDGFTIHKYYPTLSEAISGEIARLSAKT